MLVTLPYETTSFLPYYVGQELGFFREAGIELDYLYTLSGGQRGGKRKGVELCIAGDCQFFVAVTCAVEATIYGWGDVRALCASSTRGAAIFARPTIRELSDLRGKRVMIGTGASRNEMLYLCETLGWVPGTDLELVWGDEVARVEAFKDPSIDAVCARAQYEVYANEVGFRPLTLPGAVFHDGGLCATRKLIEEQPETVQSAVNGFVRAIHFIHENRDEAIRIGARNIRWLDEAGVAAHCDVIDFSPEITDTGLRWMIGLLGLGQVPGTLPGPEQVADLTFLRRAQETLAAANR